MKLLRNLLIVVLLATASAHAAQNPPSPNDDPFAQPMQQQDPFGLLQPAAAPQHHNEQLDSEDVSEEGRSSEEEQSSSEDDSDEDDSDEDVSEIDGTPLHCAATSGKADCIRALLKHLTPEERVTSISSKNSVDEMKGTALHAAAKGGHANCIQALLEHLTHEQKITLINIRDNAGETALHDALGYVNCIQVLLENGADINAKDNKGNPFLHLAVSEGCAETVKALLAWSSHFINANNFKNLYTWLPAGHPLRKTTMTMLKCHAKKQDDNVASFLPKDVLLYLLSFLRDDIRPMIVDPSSKNKTGQTALEFAVQQAAEQDPEKRADYEEIRQRLYKEICQLLSTYQEEYDKQLKDFVFLAKPKKETSQQPDKEEEQPADAQDAPHTLLPPDIPASQEDTEVLQEDGYICGKYCVIPFPSAYEFSQHLKDAHADDESPWGW